MLDYFTALLNAKYLNPSAFWLLILTPIVFLFAYKAKKDSLSFAILRTIVFLLILLSLALPSRQITSSEKTLFALFDVSASINREGKESLVSNLASFLKNSNFESARIFPYASDLSKDHLSISKEAKEAEILDLIESNGESLDISVTNTESSLAKLLSQSASASVLLLSDGYDSSGSLKNTGELAKKNNVRLYPLTSNEEAFRKAGLSISSLHTPLTNNINSLIPIRVSVKNSYQSKKKVLLELSVDQKEFYREEITVPAEEEKLVLAKYPAIEGGEHKIGVIIKDLETDSTAAEQSKWFSIKEKSKILLISGEQSDKTNFKDLLSQKGYSIKDVLADETENLEQDFSKYSILILNNASKKQLTNDFLGKVEQYVSDGGGLLILGGNRSYGLGDYIGSELEKISPLKFVPPQTKKKRLKKALMIIVDKSRSMSKNNKMTSAKKAALVAINSMNNEDSVGVIAFDVAPFEVIRLDSARRVKQKARERLSRIVPLNRTFLLESLVLAKRRLLKSKTSIKHIIILSDGEFNDASSLYFEEISSMKRRGISISTIALGLEADVPFMKKMARTGGGAFYQTLNPDKLPLIFQQDIKVNTGEITLKERSDFPVLIGNSGIHSTTITKYPTLKGFVETKVKTLARTELRTKSRNKYFPLLASWKYDKGKVTAFTSDANGRWSANWLPWSGYGKFWGEVIENTKSDPGSKYGEVDFDLRYSISENNINFDLAIFDDKLASGISPQISAEVSSADGKLQSIDFIATKAGKYLAQLKEIKAGDHRIKINYGKIEFPRLAFSVDANRFGETPGKGVNITNLAEAAFVSGGIINPEPNQLITEARKIETKEYLFTPLVTLAFLLLILETIVREIGIRNLLIFLFGTKFKRNQEVLQRGVYEQRKNVRNKK